MFYDYRYRRGKCVILFGLGSRLIHAFHWHIAYCLFFSNVCIVAFAVFLPPFIGEIKMFISH